MKSITWITAVILIAVLFSVGFWLVGAALNMIVDVATGRKTLEGFWDYWLLGVSWWLIITPIFSALYQKRR